ncbi:ToxD-like protein [Fusarium heterosporum]|uniref:ToxD-like protein n=1 Tax=Fusarium heterosporum TaxID=42747 RepID=A0A8H5T9H0_FUSHE|nr:ToxD-like protein [Fusarium heterosporum]
MSRPHKAIYMPSPGKHEIRTIQDPYVPEAAQSLVEVQYSAINPADTRHSYMNMTEYVAGYEFTGTVRDIGPESPFKVGQDIFGISTPYDHRPNHLGAHQTFLLAEPLMSFERPSHLDPITAVTLLAGAGTTFDALFNELGYGFSLAGIEGTNPKDEPILIWGGAGAVGQAAIQIAKAAGFGPIFTTASPQNHEALKKLGATEVFDYRSPSVVEDIRAAVRSCGKPLKTGFDAVASGLGIFDGLTEEQEKAVQDKYDQSSPALTRQCCDPDVPSDELRLTAVLPVTKDPTWSFCLNFRPIEMLDIGGEVQDRSNEEMKAAEEKLRVAQRRIEQGIHWLIKNHEQYWEAPRARVVKGLEEGLQGIHDVWSGKTSREKLVIDHRA